jgi:hypothetical protein
MTILTMFCYRNVDCWDLVEGGQFREFEGIIFVSLAFDIFPPPRFSTGIGDDNLVAEALAKVVYPPGNRTGFNHDLVGFSLIQQLLQCPPLGGDCLELTLVGCGVKGAGNRVEFTQVNGENLHAILLL